MIPADTGPLVALVNRNDPNHRACVEAAKALPRGPFLTTWPCFTEAMYLVHRAAGHPAQQALWRLHLSGRLSLHQASPAEVERMAALMQTYRDLPMDLADASLVAMAESLGLSRIFTLDRHFHAYRMADGSAPTVVP